MSSNLGVNKIAAAILATALGFHILHEVPHALMHVDAPEKPVYALEIIEAPKAGEAVAPIPFPQADWVEAFASGDGENEFKACTQCHTVAKGGADGTGPNLYNIIGAAAGVKEGYKYSSAMAKSGVTWDYESLDAFLKKPAKYVKGTKMSFGGIKKAEKRAALVAYLNSFSDTPAAAPVAAVIETAEEVTEEVVLEEVATEVVTEIKEKVEEQAGGH